MAAPAECGIGKLGILQRSVLTLAAHLLSLGQLPQLLMKAPLYA
ncbi:Uncharacterised protein [Edwardsiella hoshinae]|uniref:Uncharacterized protein n=1 Tax=Edwardsiella hoshinae TaxID=93378 RepID=A0A376DHM3_9GAMM|nr:Uncharacterised protein [Edwardsiella hoshinae]